MKQFEYKIIDARLIDDLNKEGLDGWEIVCQTMHYSFLCKKEIPKTKKCVLYTDVKACEIKDDLSRREKEFNESTEFFLSKMSFKKGASFNVEMKVLNEQKYYNLSIEQDFLPEEVEEYFKNLNK